MDFTTFRVDGVPDPLTNCINDVFESGTSLAWLIPFTGEREDCESEALRREEAEGREIVG